MNVLKIAITYLKILGILGFAACTHISPTSSTRQIATVFSCEAIFTETTPSAQPTSGLTVANAKDLITQQRFQEAAWLLRQIGDKTRANALENQIANDLTSLPIKEISIFNSPMQTVSEVYLVTFENGLKGIFKPDPKYWKTKKLENGAAISNPNSEVLSYRMSQFLDMTEVPVTVKRTIENMEGSLQVFVDLKTSYNYSAQEIREPQIRKQVFEISYNPQSIQRRIVELFDFLTYNMDRHAGNWGAWYMGPRILEGTKPGQGSGVVAIDNGASFQNQLSAKGNSPPKWPSPTELGDLSKYKSFFDALQNQLTEGRIQELMQGTFPQDVIDQTISRRKRLLEMYAKKP